MIRTLLLWLLVVFVAYMVVKEIVNYLNVQKYAKQGFASGYYPVLGSLKPVLEGLQTLGNTFSGFQKLAQKFQGQPGIVFNHAFGLRSTIYLMDIDLIREFLSMENEVAQRYEFVQLKTSLGFFFMGGDRALAQRQIFSKVFRRDNLNKLAPKLISQVDDWLGSAEISENPSGIRIGKYENSLKLMEHVIMTFTQNMVYPSTIQIPTCSSGLNPGDEVGAIAELVISPRGASHPLNLIFGGLPHQWNLLPGSREADRRGRDLIRVLEVAITQREKQLADVKPSEFTEADPNIIDVMILHNKEASAEDKLTLFEMAGITNLFSQASIETTFTAAKSIMYLLGQHQDVQAQLIEAIEKSPIAQGIRDIDAIDDCPILNEFVLEALRIYPPAPMTFERRVLRDFKLGKLQFYKGDLISTAIATNMWDPTRFPSAREFRLNNRKPATKKYHIPFSTGKRACIGLVVAELELKQMMIGLLRRYKIMPVSKPEEVKYHLSVAMKLDDCFVTLIPRPKI